MIGGAEADAVLQAAITQEGVSQLARLWLADGLEPGRGTFSTKVNTIAFIRGRAAMGLVLTDKTDNIEIVKSVYSEIRGPVVKVPPNLYSGIMSAMAAHGYIKDNGREKFYQVYFGSHRRVGELRPYIKRYK